MIIVEKNKIFDKCDNCEVKGEIIFVTNEYSGMALCKDCLNELKNRLTEYLNGE